MLTKRTNPTKEIKFKNLHPGDAFVCSTAKNTLLIKTAPWGYLETSDYRCCYALDVETGTIIAIESNRTVIPEPDAVMTF